MRWGGLGVKLLCLSNGHGEDAIAMRILRQVQNQPQAPEMAVLPLVGQGLAYQKLPGVPIIGPVQSMPSGGFIYMDGQQLWRDLRSGLLQLTWQQLQTVRTYAQKGWVILAVGDILPMLMAWWSGAPYAFVGTSKSEYYLRDEAGLLPDRQWFDLLETWFGSVYLPWERWLMRRRQCKAVLIRDELTAETLRQFGIDAVCLGNSMMDDLEIDQPPVFYGSDIEQKETARPLTVALLPGSRAPEAYSNWHKIITGVLELMATMEKATVFLAAIAPGLSLSPLCQTLSEGGWVEGTSGVRFPGISDSEALYFTRDKGMLVLSQHSFGECLRLADMAIAMAGTATEQFVGLGKPAIALSGTGPQFTPAFAEAQTRLLGPSVILAKHPTDVGKIALQLLRDPDRLHLIAENGRRRMGKPGASQRIAAYLMTKFGF